MRKTSVIPAAVLAAGFIFGLVQSAEARTSHKKAAPPDAKSPAATGHVSGSAKSSPRSTKKTAVRTAAKSSHGTRHSARPKAVVETAAVRAPEVYGPFQPAVAYDYPQPPCAEFDVVNEAYEHEADDDSPEADDAVDTMPDSPAGNPLKRVARTVGSWLRPKSSESTVRPEDVDLSDLIAGGVQIPVEGVDVSRLKDSFLNSRGRHRQHLAIDIGAPKGTPVLAAADGEIMQMRHEKRGGITLYQKDATGKYLLFYCHLTKYAQGLRPGQRVSKGDVIAYVGRTGHVIGGPHLHFSITRLPDDDDNFKAGVAINPYLLFLAAVP